MNGTTNVTAKLAGGCNGAELSRVLKVFVA
jgi:hypothetical protein